MKSLRLRPREKQSSVGRCILYAFLLSMYSQSGAFSCRDVHLQPQKMTYTLIHLESVVQIIVYSYTVCVLDSCVRCCSSYFISGFGARNRVIYPYVHILAMLFYLFQVVIIYIIQISSVYYDNAT